MHGGDAARLQPGLHRQVEIRRVDTDEHVRLPVQYALSECLAQAQQAWQVAQHFGQPHHGQFAGIEPGLAAGLAHGRAGDAGKLGIRMVRPQGRDQPGTQTITRGFTGHQGNAQRPLLHTHRSNGRSACSMNSSISRTSSLASACSDSWVLASASGSPATYRVR